MTELQKLEQKRPLPGALPQEVERLVDQLFAQMFGASPQLKSLFTTEQELSTAKRQWILAFAENGVNQIDQVREGMRRFRAKNNPWLPSTGEFISWCKGNEYRVYGLPEPGELLPRLEQFKDRWFKPIDYRSNAEYWLLSAIERKQKSNIWIKTEELQKFAEAELNSVLAKLKQGVQYGKPETKELDKPRKPKLSRERQQVFWQNLRKKTGIRGVVQ